MLPLLIYFIKVNVALGILYLFYKLAFSRDTFFGLRRLVLLLICVTAFIYPFFDTISWFGETESPVVYALTTLYSITLPEIFVTPEAALINAAGHFNGWFIALLSVYLLGGAFLAIRTGCELNRIVRALKRCPNTHIYEYPVRLMKDRGEPHSFFHWIFVHPVSHTKKELTEILVHEQTHVRELHSLDILLIQMVIILCWFNPFAWLLRSEIRMNHEYLADKQVIALGHDKKAYQYHLIGIEYSSMAAANLYNNFSVLPLKNRIKMLNKRRTRNIMRSKYLMFIPVVALLIFFSNCANKSQQTEADKTENVSSEIKSDTLAKESTIAPEVEIKIADEKKDVTKASVNASASDGETVLELCEQMPRFPGGDNGLMAHLRDNIQYPLVSIEKQVQGKVILQFVVNKDGSISEVAVVRGVDPELDKEAVRVIKKMPKWEPGKQDGKSVRVKYTVPVTFKLQ